MTNDFSMSYSELLDFLKSMDEQMHPRKEGQKIITYLVCRGIKKDPVVCPVTKATSCVYMIHVSADEKLCVYCVTDDDPWEICEAANIQLASTWVVA